MTFARERLAKLRDIAESIANGSQVVNGHVRDAMRRAAQVGRTVMWDMRTKGEQALGKTEMRRIRGDSEHCPDCDEYAALQWQPIGSLPMPGEGSVCGGHCRCSVVYR